MWRKKAKLTLEARTRDRKAEAETALADKVAVRRVAVQPLGVTVPKWSAHKAQSPQGSEHPSVCLCLACWVDSD